MDKISNRPKCVKILVKSLLSATEKENLVISREHPTKLGTADRLDDSHSLEYSAVQPNHTRWSKKPSSFFFAKNLSILGKGLGSLSSQKKHQLLGEGRMRGPKVSAGNIFLNSSGEAVILNGLPIFSQL